MVKILFTVIALAATTLAAQPRSLDAVCGIEEGLQHDFRFQKQMWHDGRLIRDARGTIGMTLRTETDGVLTLVTLLDAGDFTFSPEQLNLLGLTEEDLRAEVTFVLNDQMSIVGLRDWEALRDRTVETTNTLFDVMVRAGMATTSEAAELKQRTIDALSTEQAVLQLYSNRIEPYLFGYGWLLVDRTPVEQDVVLPNPFGEEGLPGYSTAQFRDGDEPSSLLKYSYEQHLHPLKANAVMRSTLAMRGLAKDEIELQLRDLQMDSYFTWSYNEESQTIEKAQVHRVSKLPGSRTLVEEKLSWELISDTESD